MPYKHFKMLNSRIKIDILNIISNKECTVTEVTSELKNRGYKVKYRESIYRHLEKYNELGLVEKKYDPNEKKITYTSKYEKIIFNIKEQSITFL